MDYGYGLREREDSITVLLAGNMLYTEFKVAGKSKNAELNARAVFLLRKVAFLCFLE